MRSKIVWRQHEWQASLTVNGVVVWRDDCRRLPALHEDAAKKAFAFRVLMEMGHTKFKSWDQLVEEAVI